MNPRLSRALAILGVFTLAGVVNSWIASLAYSLRLRYISTLAKLNALKEQVFASAYFLWALRTLSSVAVTRRHGSSYVEKGFAIILLTIFLAVALYVTAFIFPGALTAIATTALTSVNPGVQTLFQTLIPVVAVVTEVLLYISVVRAVLT